jgi:serine protease AprX
MACNKCQVMVFAIVLFSFGAEAQMDRYMVFFKDKKGSPYSISQPQEFLSTRAIERRIRQGLSITEQDLPSNPEYINGVRGTGANVFFHTKWFNGVLVQCSQNLITAIQTLPYVDHVEFVAPMSRLSAKAGRTKFNLRKQGRRTDETANQLSMLGIHDMHAAGFHGEGMIIAVFDAGFPGVDSLSAFENLFASGKVNLEVSQDFIRNSDNVFQYDDHGTQVFSVMAASVPDMYTGGATEASFQLYVTEDAVDEYRIEEYNWAFAAERADSAGADIIQSSLGYYDFDDASMNYAKQDMDGETAVVTRAAQWAADRGMVVVVSAGNEGNIAWQIISAPADARDVLAVGGVDANRNRTASSSKGPTADNRIKPDVAARGAGVRTIMPDGSLGSASGTSLSCPLITSLVAGVWQRYPELTNIEVMNVIRQSASQAANPDNLLGYGIPNFKAVVNYRERIPQDHDFEIYPNPINDTIRLTVQEPEQITSCEVELVSSIGQVLYRDTAQFSWLNRTYSIDSTQLARGMYYMRVWYGKKKMVFKIVKD